MAYNYRCSIRRRCGKHTTLAHLIDWYIRRPKCPACGKDTLKFAAYSRVATMKRTCRCSGIPWPHKKGAHLNSGEFCEHAKVDLDFEGSRVRNMRPGDDCPF